jgi:hypothetical protein
LRGLDLNQRPLGYDSCKIRIINELENVVGSFKERQVVVNTLAVLVFGVEMGLKKIGESDLLS